ncbi:phosphate acyltransferase [Alkalihalobacterium alkalinitrilicum]|uniref:phosphate acyltransferase n=1 Tax=Alkalihalobacterium alkalinitrilicum TaxID=427920 RepID=UPI0009959B1F|nr:phosphate acyltransferase [Alkalihalobacterium alkalinitrilicum]
MWSETLIEQLSNRNKKPVRILFPEGDDIRVQKACQVILNKKLAQPILFTNSNIQGIETVWETGWETGNKKLEIAAEWLKEGRVDGVISGACYESGEVIRVGLKKIGLKNGRKRITGIFVVDTGLRTVGNDGVLLFTDPIVIPQPTTEDLMEIIKGATELWELIFSDVDPKVALLDFMTCNGHFEKVNKQSVMDLKKTFPGIHFDGPLQVDAAIVPEVALTKAPKSDIAGRANILIFPDLKSGNIGYKLVERLGGAKAFSYLTGFEKSWNDLSRGCRWEDVVVSSCLSILEINSKKTSL